MFFFLFLNLVYLTDKLKQDKIVLAIEVRCHIENGDFEKAKELSLKYFGFDIDKEGKDLQLEKQKRMIYDMAGKVIDASVKEMEEEFKIKREQKEASEKENKESAKEESEKESVSDETPKFKDFLKNDKKPDSLENSDDTKPLLKSSKKPTPCQEESTDSEEDTLSDLRSYEKASTLSARRKYINSSAFSSSSDTEKRFKKEKNYSKSETRRIQAHLKKLKLNSSPDIGAQKNCNGPINITKSFLRNNIIVSCGSAPCTCCLRTLQKIYLPEINESDDNTPSLSEERFAGGIPNKLYEKRQRTCSAASSADYCMFCNPKLNEKQCDLSKKSEAKKLTKLTSVEEEDVEDFMEDPDLKSKLQEEVVN